MTQMAADDRHGICANLRHLRLTQQSVHQARVVTLSLEESSFRVLWWTSLLCRRYAPELGETRAITPFRHELLGSRAAFLCLEIFKDSVIESYDTKMHGTSVISMFYVLVEVNWRLFGVELDDSLIANLAIIGNRVLVPLDGHVYLRIGNKRRRRKSAILPDANHLPFSL